MTARTVQGMAPRPVRPGSRLALVFWHGTGAGIPGNACRALFHRYACHAAAMAAPRPSEASPYGPGVPASSVQIFCVHLERHFVACALQPPPCLPDRLGQVRSLQVAVRAAIGAPVDFLL